MNQNQPQIMTNRPTPPPPPPVRSLKTKKSKTKPGKTGQRKKGKKPLQKKPVRKELSAGGVAVRKVGDKSFVALLMTEHKRGKVWVLPKGHVELQKNERISHAAKREVEEEAGLKDLSVKDQLGVTRFTFQAEETVVRKTVHYFLMFTGQKTLVPQAEEGLIDAKWFAIDEAIDRLEYDTDKDIVMKAKEKIYGRSQVSSRKTPRVHA